MNSTITITPEENIDYNQGKVIDEKKIEKRTYDSYMDVLTFYDTRHKSTRRGNLFSVSLYDDLIVEGEKRYKILHMLSK